ncbi:MAG: hypothetical protein HOP15_10610 [Planctomycetes bacterium]|nr:hypothetical protein [Planctomycetota bacterium]
MNLTRLSLSVLLAAALVLAGCSKEHSATDGHDHGDAIHAEPGVTPGSHADWCAEHEIAESKCTRCDPSLVAAFKATHDWCAEHGLPESHCVQCDPRRKSVRPPKSGGE